MNEDFTRTSGHLAVLRRRGWIIVLVALLGAVAGALLAPLQPVSYAAETVVLVPEQADPADVSAIETQVQVVRSDVVVSDVIDQLGLPSTPEDLLDAIDVAVLDGTTALSITATRDDPDDAAALADAFAASYAETFSARELERVSTLTTSLNEQLDATIERLVDLRQELPTLSGVERAETQGAIQRESLRQARLVDLLADAEDPTLAPGDVSVLQEAVVPPTAGPSRLRGALLGLVLGLVIGTAIAYTRHHRDRRIWDETQLTSGLGGIPVLGRVPPGATTQPGDDTRDPASKVSGAFHSLAVALRLTGASSTGAAAGAHTIATAPARPGAVVMVASASPGEGKSTVAADLAVVLASLGLRVVLVDADLRNPQLGTRFGVSNTGPGLVDALSSEDQAAVRTVDVDVDRLTLLTAGPLHPDPASLLTSARAAGVWQALAGRADVVVVDTAPVLYAAETLELATTADRIVLVVERKRTTVDDVQVVLDRMAMVGASPTGVVLNKVAAREVVGGYYPRRD